MKSDMEHEMKTRAIQGLYIQDVCPRYIHGLGIRVNGLGPPPPPPPPPPKKKKKYSHCGLRYTVYYIVLRVLSGGSILRGRGVFTLAAGRRNIISAVPSYSRVISITRRPLLLGCWLLVFANLCVIIPKSNAQNKEEIFGALGM